MKHKLNSNQRGAVALITVIFIAILLTIVTTGFIRITIDEQRQATDDDLTKRAYFAAESGLEDAKIALDKYLNGEVTESELKGDECDEPDFLDAEIENLDGIEASYTCQLITLASRSYESEVPAWDSRLIPLTAQDPTTGAITDFNSLTLSWHDPTTSDGSYAVRADTAELVKATEWNDGAGVSYPAMMRLQVVGYPSSGSFDIDGTINSVIYVNPTDGVSPSYNISLAANDGAIVAGGCTDEASLTETYACEVTLTGFDDGNYNYALRATALYTGANVEVVLDGGTLDLAGASAIIDVTGRAGDVYRRVQARVSLTGPDLLPDAAVLSANDICKNFKISDVADDPANEKGFFDINPYGDPFTDPLLDPNSLCGQY